MIRRQPRGTDQERLERVRGAVVGAVERKREAVEATRTPEGQHGNLRDRILSLSRFHHSEQRLGPDRNTPGVHTGIKGYQGERGSGLKLYISEHKDPLKIGKAVSFEVADFFVTEEGIHVRVPIADPYIDDNGDRHPLQPSETVLLGPDDFLPDDGGLDYGRILNDPERDLTRVEDLAFAMDAFAANRGAPGPENV